MSFCVLLFLKAITVFVYCLMMTILFLVFVSFHQKHCLSYLISVLWYKVRPIFQLKIVTVFTQNFWTTRKHVVCDPKWGCFFPLAFTTSLHLVLILFLCWDDGHVGVGDVYWARWCGSLSRFMGKWFSVSPSLCVWVCMSVCVCVSMQTTPWNGDN